MSARVLSLHRVRGLARTRTSRVSQDSGAIVVRLCVTDRLGAGLPARAVGRFGERPVLFPGLGGGIGTLSLQLMWPVHRGWIAVAAGTCMRRPWWGGGAVAAATSGVVGEVGDVERDVAVAAAAAAAVTIDIVQRLELERLGVARRVDRGVELN